MIKIFLDDLRPTPDGFIRTYTVEETIKAILEHDGNIDTVSLDNDLGDGLDEGRKVMDWIEASAYFDMLRPIPNLLIHSGNNVAVDGMKMARTNAYKYWEEYKNKR